MLAGAIPQPPTSSGGTNMEFKCKLAHQRNRGLVKISAFNSAKELFQKISDAFQVPMGDILFCTLNADDPRNMESLLGNFLSVGDLIVVHLSGNTKVLRLAKTDEFLGLTITDNGLGKAFVKRVRSSDAQVSCRVRPGDHIASIDGQPTLGKRHFEVARLIRDIPKQATFTLTLVEPLGAGETDQDTPYVPQVVATPPSSFETAAELVSLVELGADDASLPIERLISRGARERKSQVGPRGGVLTYRATIERINEQLESFLGISDTCLAVQLYRLASEHRRSREAFSGALHSSGDLGSFNFDLDTERAIWGLVNEPTAASASSSG